MKKIGVESGNRGWGIDVSRTRIAVGSLAGSGAPSIRYTPTIKPSLRGLVRSIRKYTRWTPIKFARARDDDGARGRVRGGGRRARGAGPYVPRAVCNVRHDPTRSATYIPENFPFFFFSISPALRPPVRNPIQALSRGRPRSRLIPHVQPRREEFFSSRESRTYRTLRERTLWRTLKRGFPRKIDYARNRKFRTLHRE